MYIEIYNKLGSYFFYKTRIYLLNHPITERLVDISSIILLFMIQTSNKIYKVTTSLLGILLLNKILNQKKNPMSDQSYCTIRFRINSTTIFKLFFRLLVPPSVKRGGVTPWFHYGILPLDISVRKFFKDEVHSLPFSKSFPKLKLKILTELGLIIERIFTNIL